MSVVSSYVYNVRVHYVHNAALIHEITFDYVQCRTLFLHLLKKSNLHSYAQLLEPIFGDVIDVIHFK